MVEQQTRLVSCGIQRVVELKNIVGFERKSEVTQSCLTLCDPMDYSPPAPPSNGFSRKEYWSGLPFPSPGDLPDPGIEPRSSALQADALLSEPLTTKNILSNDKNV